MKSPNNIFLNSLLTLLIFIGVIFISGSVASILTVSVFDSTPEDDLILTGCLQACMFIFSILLISIFSKRKIGNYGFKLGKKVSYVKIILWVFIIDLLFQIALFFVEIKGEGHFASKFTFLQEIVLIWILASTAEEIFTRGLLMSFMSPLKKYGFTIAKANISYPVIFCAILFSAMHLPLLIQGIDKTLGIMILFSTFGLGIIAGYFREKSCSLLPAIIAHSSANIIGFALPLIIEKMG